MDKPEEVVTESDNVVQEETAPVVETSTDQPEETTGGLKDELKGGEEAGIKAELKEEAAEEVAESIEYTDFTLPDGMAMDEEMLAEFIPIAKELGLQQDNAQKFIDLQAKAAAKQQASLDAEIAKEIDEWKSSVKQGDKYKDNLKHVGRALDQLGEEHYKALQELGIEWHPTIFEILTLAGSNLAEGRVRRGDGANPQPKKPMYDAMEKYKRERGIS